MPIALFLLMAALSGCARDHYVMTNDGVQIAYEYKRVVPEKGTAVLLHGMGTSLEEWYDFSRYLNEHGWSTLALDFRGHGLSTYQGSRELDWKNFKDNDFLKMLEDIEAALRVTPPSKNLWLIGSSMGADMAFLYAVRNPAVRGVVLLSPPGFRGDVGSEKAISAYGNRPFLIAASADDGIFLQTAEKMYQSMQGPKKIIRYQKAGHASTMLEHEDKLKEEIITWLNQNTI